MKNYKTARGRPIDVAAIIAKHESTRAVGNVPMNARGDRLNPDGSIKVKSENIDKTVKKMQVQSENQSLSNPTPIAHKPIDNKPTDNKPTRVTKARKDGSKFIEVTDIDGNMTIEEIKEAPKEEIKEEPKLNKLPKKDIDNDKN